MRGYDDNDMHWDGGVWLGMTLMMTIFLLALAVIIYFAARWLRESGRPEERQGRDPERRSERPSEAEQVLALRFARGEIDADEFQQRREMLRAQQDR